MSGSPSLGCGGYGPVHSVVGAATSVTDVKLAGELRHGAEEAAFGEVGYRGAHKHSEAAGPASLVVMRSGMRRKLSPFTEPQFVSEQIERARPAEGKGSNSSSAYSSGNLATPSVRYRVLKKRATEIVTLYALSKLRMARKRLLGAAG